MKETMKKMFILGVGVAVLTKDKAEKVVKDMVKQGQLSKKEGEKLVDTIIKESSKHKKNVEIVVREETTRVIKKIGPATRRELKRLNERIVVLEKRARAAPKKKKAAPKRKKKAPAKRKPAKRKTTKR